ncbi:MAG TPA: NTP transferase domain-containing protein [Candidatus Angelobacter sp.]|nr:NTP transferase domain-containing protein [Candidatus Angelobacter sp.]
MSGKQNKTGVSAVVLAAGASRRLGTPKQLLRIGGETILERTLKNVRASSAAEIVLVLGHAAESVENAVSTEQIKVVRNPDYQQGMGTSLRTGLAAISADAGAALIVLADQPFVRPETLNELIACHQESKPQIIIPMYQGFRGNPVLLDRSVFEEVKGLNGDVGCRAIFGDHTEGICKLPVDDAGILLDIDSRSDFETLRDAGSVTGIASPRASGIARLESKEDIPASRPELVLVGRDALAQALAKLGRLLNFTVTVVDPFLGLAGWPEADRALHALDFSLLPQAAGRYVVVASRGQFDEEAVAQALQAGSLYVALVANKQRAQEVVRSLGAQSIPAEKLAAVRAPAGLEIGAETPEEIALSIMAEIVATRRQEKLKS